MYWFRGHAGHSLHESLNERPLHGAACSYPDGHGLQSVHVNLSFHMPFPVHLPTPDAYLPCSHVSHSSQSLAPSLFRMPVPVHGASTYPWDHGFPS